MEDIIVALEISSRGKFSCSAVKLWCHILKEQDVSIIKTEAHDTQLSIEVWQKWKTWGICLSKLHAKSKTGNDLHRPGQKPQNVKARDIQMEMMTPTGRNGIYDHQ